jgi:hypothetical protein
MSALRIHHSRLHCIENIIFSGIERGLRANRARSGCIQQHLPSIGHVYRMAKAVSLQEKTLKRLWHLFYRIFCVTLRSRNASQSSPHYG